MSGIKILIQQQPKFNAQFQQIYYGGSSPMTLNAVVGTLPPSRQWPSYGNFFDITQYTANADELSLEWTLEVDNDGNSSTTGFNIKKGTSGGLQFEDEAFRLMKQWLIDDVSASLNAVDVKIFDSGCNQWFEGYEITAKDLQYCESEICVFDVNLKQKEEALSCIQSTLIEDNWQGWFQPEPTNGKKHPRFSYCNEIRPNGQLVVFWNLLTVNFMIVDIILIPIVLIINLIILLVNGIVAIINAIDAILGTGHVDPLKFLDIQDILETQRQQFVEAAGCGREHPAPLIRDYISNVCGKCGVKVDAASAPIFFAQNITINTSARGLVSDPNPYYNACYLNIPNQRGIRRFDLTSPFLAPDYNDTEYWIPQNAPALTLDLFLDEIKGVFNAEWLVIGDTLHIKRKDFYDTGDYIFDFSKNGPDRPKILNGVCYEFDGQKQPAITKGIYTQDGADSCGDEARSYMNALVKHGTTQDNPNFKGIQDKTVQYGATRFRLDGNTPDYIYDAAQVSINTQFALSFFSFVADAVRRIPDYCLLLKDETASFPKIIIWDGEGYDQARCIRTIEALPGPTPNTKYNGADWKTVHRVNTFVKGQNFNPWFNAQDGRYKVVNWVGTEVKNVTARLVNYPMYFAPEFEGSLWDYFHWIDDPKFNPRINSTWTVKIDMCCEDVQRLQANNDGKNVILGQKVKLDRPFYPDGVITKITLNYDTSNEFGSHIEISGR